MKKHIAIKIYRDEGYGYKERDVYFFKAPGLVSLPEGEPYEGTRFLLSTDGEDGYQFAPEEPQNFVRFSPNHPLSLSFYIGTKRYLLLFIAQGKELGIAFRARVKRVEPEIQLDIERVKESILDPYGDPLSKGQHKRLAEIAKKDPSALALLGLEDFKRCPLCSNGLNYTGPMGEEHFAAIKKIEEAIEGGYKEGRRYLIDIYLGKYGVLNWAEETLAKAKEHFEIYHEGMDKKEREKEFESYSKQAWEDYKEIKASQHRKLALARAEKSSSWKGGLPPSSIDPDLKKEDPSRM